MTISAQISFQPQLWNAAADAELTYVLLLHWTKTRGNVRSVRLSASFQPTAGKVTTDPVRYSSRSERRNLPELTEEVIEYLVEPDDSETGTAKTNNYLSSF